MILINKQEKEIISKLFPKEKFVRTVKQRSKRHRYYVTERIELLRPIAHLNDSAAEFVREYDRIAEAKARRGKWKKRNGYDRGTRR